MYIKLNLLLYLTRSQFGVTNVKNLRAIRLFIVIKGLLIIYSCVITLKLKVRLDNLKRYKGENKVANKKLPKSQGSCKLNKSCISYIKLVKENGKEIVAVWQKKHYGHENEIQHIRLSRADRNAVASKLAACVPKARWNVDQINTYPLNKEPHIMLPKGCLR
ncbi:hypothetical protein NQ314_017665 [Rhamnusium bicolor]|uniref:Uncharacterized protein n=1 Tax=Rhamnusium bicolor TaxID=1586634 RepID=A0AAV8WSY2_9CUCU|nr:hypothetical protein NQ314_017665 [Rhamnusium bicolor]